MDIQINRRRRTAWDYEMSSADAPNYSALITSIAGGGARVRFVQGDQADALGGKGQAANDLAAADAIGAAWLRGKAADLAARRNADNAAADALDKHLAAMRSARGAESA